LKIFGSKAKVKNILRPDNIAVIMIYIKQFPMPDRAFAIIIGISGARAVNETSLCAIAIITLSRALLLACDFIIFAAETSISSRSTLNFFTAYHDKENFALLA
jgi:predicted tellurium resistance membrane protein TerC